MRFATAALTAALAASTLVADVGAQQTTQYVRYEQNGQASWGILEGSVEDGTIRQLSDAPYLDGAPTGQTVERAEVKLLAPVDAESVFMTALNFRSHIQGEPAEYPGLFIVPPNSIIGPEEQIIRPPDSSNLHYEAEMVAVVGREAVNVPIEEAGDYIFGVSAGNDVSERGWQFADQQWTRAKGSRTFNAVGPVLVAGLDYQNLDIAGRMNDETELRQGENTSDMVFGIDYMLSYISRYFTLKPGDLIWTGTMGTTQAMEPGDVYHVEVEGVGVLSNEVVQGR